MKSKLEKNVLKISQKQPYFAPAYIKLYPDMWSRDMVQAQTAPPVGTINGL